LLGTCTNRPRERSTSNYNKFPSLHHDQPRRP
jgi:hypothetical protein